MSKANVGVGLNVECVRAMPLDYDFSAEGYGDAWSVHPSCQGETCGSCHGTGEVPEGDAVDAGWECPACDGSGWVDSDDPDAGMPMMNYLYPLGRVSDPDDFGRRLEHLPLTAVEVGGEWFLALTGGGMDLSWEICAGYVALGYYPPAHFCRLPKMAGRGERPADQRLLAICRESLEILARWAAQDVAHFDADWPAAAGYSPPAFPKDEADRVAAELEESGESRAMGHSIEAAHSQGYRVDGPVLEEMWFPSLGQALAALAARS